MSRDQPSPLNKSERFNNMKQICLKYIFSTGMPTLEQFRSIYGKILTNSFSLRTDRYSFYVFTLIVTQYLLQIPYVYPYISATRCCLADL